MAQTKERKEDLAPLRIAREPLTYPNVQDAHRTPSKISQNGINIRLA
jgi:hypothetical protein